MFCFIGLICEMSSQRIGICPRSDPNYDCVCVVRKNADVNAKQKKM